MNIQKLNEKLKEILETGKELTTVNEDLDTLEIMSKKLSEVRTLIKDRFCSIIDKIHISDISHGINAPMEYRQFMDKLWKISNIFSQIDDYINEESKDLQENPKEKETEIKDWYKNNINKLFVELDSILKEF